MINEFLTRLKNTFYESLQQKNSWGKNEVWLLFMEIVSSIIVDMFTEELNKTNEEDISN